MPETNPNNLNAALSTLEGRQPIALLPVKLQTRFATAPMVNALGSGNMPAPRADDPPVELWVRIYPDDIFVHTHEDRLTEDELAAAVEYWNLLWAAADATNREEQKAGAWRSLAEDYGPVRARYILRETQPTGGIDAAGFPQSPPQLPDLDTMADSWSSAPRTYVLPDRFIVSLKRNETQRHFEGNLISKDAEGALRLGLDPGSTAEFEDSPEGRRIPEDLKWMTDFPKAVEVGMGLRIPLEAWAVDDRIDSLTVLGWRSGETPEEGAAVLERLLENHRYKVGGMDLAAVGTPTNNTRGADAELSPEDRGPEEDNLLTDNPSGSDAAQLARALGLPPGTFSDLGHSSLSSITDARKVHELLFDVTLGQALDFWQPSLDAGLKADLREHFTAWVSGRGHLPALQIDDQPYGILPALPFSTFNTDHPDPEGSLQQQLWDQILWPLHKWYTDQLDEVAHIKRGISPRKAQLQLLSILQLHPTSVSYRQRFALRPEVAGDEALRNIFQVPEGDPRAARAGSSISDQLNANNLPEVERLNGLLFETQARPLLWETNEDGQLVEAVDEDVLIGMEGGVIPPLPGSTQNYLQWLAEESNSGDPPGDEPPHAVLYHLLRRRLQQPASTGPGAIDLLREIKDWPAPYLRRMVQEHLDCCTYRLDAWLSSYAARRLQEIRTGAGSTGLYIGAWGYLENLQRETRAALPEYIPAPSLRHATTAAVLRSGYQNSRSSGTGDGLFAVGLSSGRMKNALFLLEGVRNGQDLSALLGYRLERSMQEFRRGGVPTLAPFIQDLRDKYRFEVIPVVAAGQNSAPDTEEDQSQRVIDAVALIEDEAESWRSIVADAAEADLAAFITDLADQLDSVKDLLAAEGVYQLVDGQVDRAKAALDAMTDGEQPTRPEIADQPRSSLPLTFRMGVLLHDRPLPVTGGAPLSPRALTSPKLNRWLFDQLPDLSFIKVRVRWQTGMAEDGSPVFETATLPLRHLGIEPIDLVYMMHMQRENPDTSELQYRIERVLRQQQNLPLTTRIQILEQDRTGFGADDYTLFAMEPLAAGLGKLLMETRSLRPEDFLRANEESADAAGQLWAPEFLRRQLRNVVLKMEDMEATLGNALNTAQGLADSLSGNESHPQLEQRLRSIREDTFFYAGLGWVKAVPPAIERLDKLTLEQEIRRCRNIHEDARQRMAQAREQWASGSAALLSALMRQPPPGQDAAGEVALLEAITELLFGRFYRIYPDFRLPDPEVLQQSMNDPELKASADGFAIERWLQTQAPLRPQTDIYYRCNMLTDLFGGTKEGDGFALLQLPLLEGKPGPWVGWEYGDFVPHGDTMAMALELQKDFSFSNGTFSGLLVDDWQELVPDPEVNAGIALQYDQPDTEAPNAVLLAMTPRAGAAWDWPTLQGAVLDNLHLSKIRAVDPDIIRASFLDQLLPLALGEVAVTEEEGELRYDGLLFGPPPGEQRIVAEPPTDISDDDLAGLDLGNTIE
ncbi:MAG: hypothetical protein RIC19_19145 [Phaeodactylibacter sp.]|uniref:hypothetical protein n=1 Tax=Phaeodactylibacter sp. TaxID=1940289 RepID=UPI0032EF63C5